MAKRKVFDGSVYKDIENKKITTNFPESGGYPETYRMLEECLGWTFFSEPKEVVIDEFCQQLHKTMTEEEIKNANAQFLANLLAEVAATKKPKNKSKMN